jgi:hypothetical protein
LADALKIAARESPDSRARRFFDFAEDGECYELLVISSAVESLTRLVRDVDSLLAAATDFMGTSLPASTVSLMQYVYDGDILFVTWGQDVSN